MPLSWCSTRGFGHRKEQRGGIRAGAASNAPSVRGTRLRRGAATADTPTAAPRGPAAGPAPQAASRKLPRHRAEVSRQGLTLRAKRAGNQAGLVNKTERLAGFPQASSPQGTSSHRAGPPTGQVPTGLVLPQQGARGYSGPSTLSPPTRKRSTAAPLMPCRSQSPDRTSLMGSPALTSTVQDVPSGSWTQQYAALALSGAKVLQASDWGARDRCWVAGSCGRPREGCG